MASQYASPPEMVIDPSKDYTATITTNQGTITAKLFADEAPNTVNNFVFLAREGFYDGVIFHRVIKGFMLQGGDPTGTGTGGPGYKFADELAASRSRGYKLGTLAMANSGPNTNGSQFFIVTADAADWLDGKHTVFGQVKSGEEVVQALEALPTDGRDRPQEPAVIETLEVTS